MIKAQNLKPNARSRRDERRKAKQQAWAAANPMLVGRRYQKVGEMVKIIRKPGYTPKPLAVIASLAKRETLGYRNQIIRATYLYEYEFGRQRMQDGSCCLPDVALFSNMRKSRKTITAKA